MAREETTDERDDQGTEASSPQPVTLPLCDGQCFRRMIEGGALWLEQHIDLVNSLNVYPVPDGDTGINMHLTMQAALKEMSEVTDSSLGSLAKAVAHGALMGARGNSGVILSQILRGIARVVGDKKSFSAVDLAAALREGSATAYKGVIKPVEGTILTVARESAEAATAAASDGLDIIAVLEAAVSEARGSVARTPTLLSVLADA